jgi:DNA-binding HxlR family transcriptional regulator
VLNARLKELREARLIDLGEQGYALTPLGRSLLETVLPLHAWAEAWAKQVRAATREPGRSGRTRA